MIDEEYGIMEEIGQGQFGKVYKGQNMRNGEIVAIKEVKMERYMQDSVLKSCINNEIYVLSQISHKNIIRLMKEIHTELYLYIVYEFCNEGNLDDYLGKKKKLSEDEAIEIMKGLLEGFKLLKKHYIIHRDIKPSNILLKDGTVKIADFGLCRTYLGKELEKEKGTLIGTPIYMAPELITGQPLNEKTDIYSLGAVFYELMFGHCPYEDSSLIELVEKQKKWPLVIPLEENPIKEKTQAILRKMLSINPDFRASWNDLFDFFDN